ncbi:hypothetical protein HZA33_04610 [Candidatus Pacearchaeota archaeon]|nr:hypothetical protein [Candidatus Pacearchaeota archaeon]
MNKWLELLLGLILVIVPIYAAWTYSAAYWGAATIEFIKGGIVVFVVLIGLLFIMLGISDLKS